MTPRRKLASLLWVALLLAGAPARGQSSAATTEANWRPPPGYRHSSLPVRHEMADVYTFDLDGDHLDDLVVVEADRSRRDIRYSVSVFRNTGHGFQALPAATGPLPAHLALAGVARLRQGPGLVLLTPGRVALWPWNGTRFDGGSATTLAVDSVFPVPGGALHTGLDWIADLDGDGISELLVPRFDGLAVLGQAPDGAFRERWRLKVRARARLLHYFRRRMVAYDLPAMRVIDVDGRGWKDVVTYDDGLLDVFLLGPGTPAGTRPPDLEQDLQPPEPFDPTKPWDPPLLLVEARDLNGDGHFDLVLSKNSASDSQFNTKTSILVYYGRPGTRGAPIGFGAKADQVFRSEGFTLPLILDINKDGRVDLVMVNVEIGFWTVIKALIARSVSAQAAFYVMPAAGRYPERPDAQETYDVKFSLGRFSHHPISSFGDLNGDGLPDLLLSVDKERLGIHWGRPGGFWHTDPDETLRGDLPISVLRMRVTDLNGDGRDDLIFLYNRDDIRQMHQVNHTFAVLESGAPAARTPHRSATPTVEGSR